MKLSLNNKLLFRASGIVGIVAGVIGIALGIKELVPSTSSNIISEPQKLESTSQSQISSLKMDSVKTKIKSNSSQPNNSNISDYKKPIEQVKIKSDNNINVPEIMNTETQKLPKQENIVQNNETVKPPKENTTQDQNIINQNINKYYGFTKDGIFYIHRTLIEKSNGDIPYLKSDLTNWDDGEKMDLKGSYYLYKARIDKPFMNGVKIVYCFRIRGGIHLPTLLFSRRSDLINDNDVILNPTKNGYNFETYPQDYLPNMDN